MVFKMSALFLILFAATGAQAADFKTVSKVLASPELEQEFGKINNSASYRFASLEAEFFLREGGKRVYTVRVTHDPSDVHDVLPDLCLPFVMVEESGAVELKDAKGNGSVWKECLQ